jgi:hypothetical protein
MSLSYSAIHLKKMTKSANIIKKTWLKKHPRNCPICMDSMGNSGCVDTPCKHKFCLKCYLKLNDPRCPLCRAGIPLSDSSSLNNNDNDDNDDDDDYDEHSGSEHDPTNRDDIDFLFNIVTNPTRFIGDLIYDVMREPINVVNQSAPDPVHRGSTWHPIGQLGFIILGLSLVILLLSPYTFMSILSLVFMMKISPIINHTTINPTFGQRPYLSEPLLNNIFPRQRSGIPSQQRNTPLPAWPRRHTLHQHQGQQLGRIFELMHTNLHQQQSANMDRWLNDQ